VSTDRFADLEARLEEMTAAYEAAIAENKTLRVLNDDLSAQLETLKRRFFGRSSEKPMADEQPQLFDEPADEQPGDGATDSDEATTIVRPHTRTKRGRKPLPDTLEREEVLLDIPEEDKHCGCGHDLIRIGEEVSEKLTIIPARFIVTRYIRPKYACRTCEGSGDEDKPAVRIRPMPPAVIPRGIATPSLLAFIITSKYVDGMPLKRQERSFARIGVDLPRQRMADWVMAVGEALEPVLQQLYHHLRAGPFLIVDETTVQVLGEQEKANTSRSYMWCAVGGDPDRPSVVYRYAPGRSTAEAEAIVGSYSGFVQADGYEVYDRLCRDRDDLILAGCWAHTRRKFVDAKSTGKKAGAAQQALSLIARIYRVETDLAELPRDEQFIAERKAQVLPVLEKLKIWLDAKALHVPPQTNLGKAVTYALGQWDKLIRYLDSPYLTPDTNRVENKIRPFVVGRSAWLFSGSPRGAAASATLYSLIETAKANGIEPHRYLLNVISRVPTASTPDDYRSLLPQHITLDPL
jgi:transposase